MTPQNTRCSKISANNYRIGVSSQLHLPDLLPSPVGVELRGSDEGQVDPEGPVDAGAVDANEDAIGDRGPGGIFRPAVKTNLKQIHCLIDHCLMNYIIIVLLSGLRIEWTN